LDLDVLELMKQDFQGQLWTYISQAGQTRILNELPTKTRHGFLPVVMFVIVVHSAVLPTWSRMVNMHMHTRSFNGCPAIQDKAVLVIGKIFQKQVLPPGASLGARQTLPVASLYNDQ
jgi:hypothetical protein